MTTFHDLPDLVVTPGRVVTQEDLDVLVSRGGYTHPLFTRPEVAARIFGRAVLPGPAVVFLMAGLVEQTDLFDESVVALLEMTETRFLAPVHPDEAIEVEVQVLSREPNPSGRRGVLQMRWTCRGAAAQDDRVTLVARMLFDLEPRGDAAPA